MTSPNEGGKVLTSTNARVLLDQLSASIEYALKHPIFEPNTKLDVHKTICDQINVVKDKGGIKDFDISNFRVVEHTWESLYPNMPHRLQAIFAEETYGHRLLDEPPAEVAFLYKRVDDYYWRYADSQDYRGSSDMHYDRLADLEEKGPHLEEIIYTSFEMSVPNIEHLVDLFVRPVKPINSIILDCVIKPDRIELKEI